MDNFEINGFKITRGETKESDVAKAINDPSENVQKLLTDFFSVDSDDIVNNDNEFAILNRIKSLKETPPEDNQANLDENEEITEFGKVLNDTVVDGKRPRTMGYVKAVIQAKNEKQNAYKHADFETFNDKVQEEYGEHAGIKDAGKHGEKETSYGLVRYTGDDVWVLKEKNGKSEWKMLKNGKLKDMINKEIWENGISLQEVCAKGLCPSMRFDVNTGVGYDPYGNYYRVSEDGSTITRIFKEDKELYESARKFEQYHSMDVEGTMMGLSAYKDEPQKYLAKQRRT